MVQSPLSHGELFSPQWAIQRQGISVRVVLGRLYSDRFCHQVVRFLREANDFAGKTCRSARCRIETKTAKGTAGKANVDHHVAIIVATHCRYVRRDQAAAARDGGGNYFPDVIELSFRYSCAFTA